MSRFQLLAPSLLILLAACDPGGEADSGEAVSGDPAAEADGKAYIKESTIWTSHVIPVCWENPTSDNAEAREIVQEAVEESWSRWSRVEFVGWGTCTSSSPGINILWSDEGPHTDRLGSNLDNNNNGMVLNHEFENWSPTCQDTVESCVRVIAVHEFGHALGFAHEHNRSDTPTWCEEEPQGSDGDAVVGDWDADSVMNYCNEDWAGDGELSATDIEAVQRYYGAPVPHVDFDNDGYDDLVIGVPAEDVGSESDHGAVNVLYGSSGGLTVSGDQLWYQDVASVEGDGEAGDDYGQALAVGDFDWDGYADVVIGVPGEAVGPDAGSGGVNVLYGTASGLSVSGDELWHQDVTDVPGASAAGDGFGGALAVGDFNRDHYMDLAIGSPYENIGTETNAGAVTILYGSASGLDAGDASIWYQDVADVEGTGESYDEFGAALAAGDLDGDGYDDLVIGVPGEAIGSEADAGAINVLYGSSSGLDVSGDQVWYQGHADLADTAEAGDGFGSALTVADFDDDGYFDVAVGVPGEDTTSEAGVGGVHLLYGTSGGLSASDDHFLYVALASVQGDADPGDAMGTSLAAGHLDGDIYADLVVGVPGAVVSSLDSAGEVMVFFGSASGVSSTGEQIWNQDTSGVSGTAAAGEEFGTAVTSGDYDGNGYCDLAAGVPDETVGTATLAGSVAVLYSDAAGPTTTGDETWNQAVTDLEGDAEASDQLGQSLR